MEDSDLHDNGGTTGVPAARQRRVARRLLATGLATLLAATGALAVTAQPASAGSTFLRPTSVAVTDAERPTGTFPSTDGTVPVGTWKDPDGDRHTSRAYFTFDLTRYHGQRIISARAITGEHSVNNCDKPRQLELWRTDTPATPPTWKDAPTARAKIADLSLPEAPCPWSYLSRLITETVATAVTGQQETLTLMIRVGDAEESLHYGRRITNLGLALEHNANPDAPGKLSVGGVACTEATFVGTTTPELQAELTDPDVNETGGGDQVTATFAWWPVDRPTERTEFTWPSSMHAPARFRYVVPQGQLVDGGHYAFAVRAADQYGDTSAWSPECRFTVDTRKPAEPTVVSTDFPRYPEQSVSGPNVPGRFTLGANGSDDVVRYQYWGYDGSGQVAADGLGGATFTYIPKRPGPHRIEVYSVDRTGNRSTTVSYEFWVRDTAPRITDGNPEGRLGQPREITFSPMMAGVTEYVWWFNGEEHTVAADADGVATVTVTPTEIQNTLRVRSRTSGGVPSGDAEYNLYVRTSPFVTSPNWPDNGWPGTPAGTEGTFVFRPAMDDVVEYVYSFDGGDPQTVAAGPDGSATITYTPRDVSNQTLEVFSRTGAGVQSESTYYAFHAASVAPGVDSQVYPRNLTGGGPGVPGTFTFTPHAGTSGVTSYVYRFADEPERTVEAGADGTATVEWTPRSVDSGFGGWVQLQVRARTAGGIVTDAQYYSFRVDPKSPLVTSDVFGPQGGAVVGQTGEFVFTSQLAGSTEFVYSIDSGPERTVAVGADGTARVTWTADSPYSHNITVRSRTVTGMVSGEAYYGIWIDWS
ncbi:hypothetical protein AB0B83_14660 [Micromonospora sp. NPDC049060]|uniref:hypothetical protein n=1 Tax=Micromonospora sp. NPDC049060 TaxID=3154828 RepID=UPI0033F0D0C0